MKLGSHGAKETNLERPLHQRPPADEMNRRRKVEQFVLCIAWYRSLYKWSQISISLMQHLSLSHNPGGMIRWHWPGKTE